MRRTEDFCRFVSLLCGLAFVWAIGVETSLLPLLFDTPLLRWQVVLLLGVACWASADHLGELRCRCCGSKHVKMRALFTPSHEFLCDRCLSWKPTMEPAPAFQRLGDSA